MFSRSWAVYASFLFPVAVRAAAQYDLVKEYAGESFFDEWTFYNNSEYELIEQQSDYRVLY